MIEDDVVRLVSDLLDTNCIGKGCNLSFIALIPKVSGPNLGKDYSRISLIGWKFKTIGKLLANHLSLIIGDYVSMEQSAFIKEMQILDGSLILNEVIG